MPTAKKSTRLTKRIPEQPAASKKARPLEAVRHLYEKLRTRSRIFLNRRPHRSFRRTRRRDYIRPLKLPGYWALTNQVRRVLWQHKKLFLLVVLTYAILSGLLVGIGSQDTYEQISTTLQSTGQSIFQGDWGQIGDATLLFTSALSSGLNDQLSGVQEVYVAIIALMVWLTSVWLLRAILAGNKPRLRDGLYNAGAPIVSTFLVGLVLVVQLLPLALAVIGITAAIPFGALDGGVLSMVVWIVAILLGVLSFYWITSTIIALVVVTLPGMYPMRAIKTAGDLVVGRRIRILFRLIWLLFTLILLWLVTMVPLMLFDSWLKGLWPAIKGVPIVPLGLLFMSCLTAVYTASYVYLFYRKVVEDGSAPA